MYHIYIYNVCMYVCMYIYIYIYTRLGHLIFLPVSEYRFFDAWTLNGVVLPIFVFIFPWNGRWGFKDCSQGWDGCVTVPEKAKQID